MSLYHPGKYWYIIFDHSKNIVANNNNDKNKTLWFTFSIESRKAHYLTKKRLGVIQKMKVFFGKCVRHHSSSPGMFMCLNHKQKHCAKSSIWHSWDFTMCYCTDLNLRRQVTSYWPSPWGERVSGHTSDLGGQRLYFSPDGRKPYYDSEKLRHGELQVKILGNYRNYILS